MTPGVVRDTHQLLSRHVPGPQHVVPLTPRGGAPEQWRGTPQPPQKRSQHEMRGVHEEHRTLPGLDLGEAWFKLCLLKKPPGWPWVLRQTCWEKRVRQQPSSNSAPTALVERYAPAWDDGGRRSVGGSGHSGTPAPAIRRAAASYWSGPVPQNCGRPPIVRAQTHPGLAAPCDARSSSVPRSVRASLREVSATRFPSAAAPADWDVRSVPVLSPRALLP